MIFYHGTPIGGSYRDAEYFLTGRAALVPYLAPLHMDIVRNVCTRFVLDNSAFTAWKQNIAIDFDKYGQWVETFTADEKFDWCIIPDVIGGSEEANDDLVRAWDDKIPGVPVFHLHQDPKRFFRLAERFPIIGIGGSHIFPNLGSRSWWTRMTELMDTICDDQGQPPAKIHGLPE